MVICGPCGRVAALRWPPQCTLPQWNKCGKNTVEGLHSFFCQTWGSTLVPKECIKKHRIRKSLLAGTKPKKQWVKLSQVTARRLVGRQVEIKNRASFQGEPLAKRHHAPKLKRWNLPKHHISVQYPLWARTSKQSVHQLKTTSPDVAWTRQNQCSNQAKSPTHEWKQNEKEKQGKRNTWNIIWATKGGKKWHQK